MKTEADYEKAIKELDSAIETLKSEVFKLAKETAHEALRMLRSKGLTVSEVIDAVNSALEDFEGEQDRIEADRIKAIEDAEDAEEARFCSTPSRPVSEIDQTRNIFDKGITDDLNSDGKQWS